MNKKIIGVILIVAGVALGIWGYNLYDSVGSQLSRTFSGDAPIEAWAAMVGGAICALIGILQLK